MSEKLTRENVQEVFEAEAPEDREFTYDDEGALFMVKKQDGKTAAWVRDKRAFSFTLSGRKTAHPESEDELRELVKSWLDGTKPAEQDDDSDEDSDDSDEVADDSEDESEEDSEDVEPEPWVEEDGDNDTLVKQMMDIQTTLSKLQKEAKKPRKSVRINQKALKKVIKEEVDTAVDKILHRAKEYTETGN